MKKSAVKGATDYETVLIVLLFLNALDEAVVVMSEQYTQMSSKERSEICKSIKQFKLGHNRCQ